MTDTSPSKIAEFVQGMRWTSEHAYGDTLDEDEVLMVLALAARIAELEVQKWEVQHTDTMNTLVQMGMARDEAIARAERAEAEVARLRLALEARVIAQRKARPLIPKETPNG